MQAMGSRMENSSCWRYQTVVAGAKKSYRRILFFFLAALAIVALDRPSPCLAASSLSAQPKKPSVSDPENNFGIKILSLRPTGAGQMLDLRFQVVDPEKARPVLDKNKKAYLLDGKTGKTLPVPVTKAGPMRQSTLKPEPGRIYFILFSNPNRMVKEGDSVSLVIGEFRKDGIVAGSSGAAPVPGGAPAVPKTGDTGKP
jgi:hypothetical protein